jgi:hypothetical protein
MKRITWLHVFGIVWAAAVLMAFTHTLATEEKEAVEDEE